MACTSYTASMVWSPKRTGWQGVLVGGLVGLGLSGAGSAQALELSLHTRVDDAQDPGLVWFSSSGSLVGLGFSVSGVLLKSPQLSWTVTYDHMSIDGSQYTRAYAEDAAPQSCYSNGYYYEYSYECSYDTTVTGELTLHRLIPGLRIATHVAPWLELFASASLEGVYGVATLTNSSQSWTMLDPDDPEGEAVLYQMQPYRVAGLGGGARAGAGATFWLAPGSGQGAGGASSPAGTPAAVSPLESLKVGLTLEAGYGFMLPISFGQAGSLDLSGPWANVGATLAF